MKVLKISWEAIRQAYYQMASNKIRTFLSLLGIAVGIFCIVAVFAAVDSLENKVKGSLESLGSGIVFVHKLPFAEVNNSNFYKYMRRPNPSFRDYKLLKDKLKGADLVVYSAKLGRKTFRYKDIVMSDVYLSAVTEKYADLFAAEFEHGRFYSYSEYHAGASVAVIGAKVAETLFGTLDAVGRKFKYKGASLRVIGVFKKTGNDPFTIDNYDQLVIFSMPLAARIANLKTNFFGGGGSLMLKVKEGVDIEDMKGEITAKLRAIRHLRPKEEDNFSLNTITMITNMLKGVFSALNLSGFIIGGFAMLVGMVSIANIMFVSVKERTSIIGVKMALGAKRWFILLEFLVESVVLSVLGGLLGLGLVRVAVIFISKAFNYDIGLSASNIMTGILISGIVGVLAGFIPAYRASRLDPVEAIRG